MRHLAHASVYGSSAHEWLSACGIDMTPKLEPNGGGYETPLATVDEWPTLSMLNRCHNCTILRGEIVRDPEIQAILNGITWHEDVERLRNYISSMSNSLNSADRAWRAIKNRYQELRNASN